MAACTRCDHHHIAYNSCKNRHCPKCQGPAARDWMEARAEDLLPVEYFHVVFTMPAAIAQIAYWNKQVVYGLLFRASAETVMTIAADPKRMGAKVGLTSVLHTSHQRCVLFYAARLWRDGIGADPPSAHPHDCARRRSIAGRQEVGGLQARVRRLTRPHWGHGPPHSCMCAFWRGCSDACFWRAFSSYTGPASSPSSVISLIWRARMLSPSGSPHSAKANGWSSCQRRVFDTTPSRPSEGPRQSSPT